METFSSPALNPSEVGPLCSHVLGLLYFMAQTPAPPPAPGVQGSMKKNV